LVSPGCLRRSAKFSRSHGIQTIHPPSPARPGACNG
jgi:hypothetical protein